MHFPALANQNGTPTPLVCNTETIFAALARMSDLVNTRLNRCKLQRCVDGDAC